MPEEKEEVPDLRLATPWIESSVPGDVVPIPSLAFVVKVKALPLVAEYRERISPVPSWVISPVEEAAVEDASI